MAVNESEEMLVCIDYRDNQKDWQKNWSELGECARTVTIETAEHRETLQGAVLVFVHASNEDVTRAKVDALLTQFDGCIGGVSAGGLTGEVTHEGRLCKVKTKFPRELRALKPSVDELIADLSVALKISEPKDRENALVRAWHRFDQEEQGIDTLAAVAILCQGYLAINAEESEKDEWGPREIRPALEQMGWPKAMEDDAVRGLLRDDLLDQRDDVAKADWWLDVFKLKGNVATQVKTLRDKLKEEWNECSDPQLPDEITQLLDGLAEGTLNASAVVADAYCKIAKKLGGSPCQS